MGSNPVEAAIRKIRLVKDTMKPSEEKDRLGEAIEILSSLTGQPAKQDASLPVQGGVSEEDLKTACGNFFDSWHGWRKDIEGRDEFASLLFEFVTLWQEDAARAARSPLPVQPSVSELELVERIEQKLDMERQAIGNVDGYDYRSGEEYGLRRAIRIVRDESKALSRFHIPPVQQTREERMVVIERDETGKPTIWCDPEIAELIKALNDAGHATVASCSGHACKPTWIALKDGRQLIITPNLEEAKALLDKPVQQMREDELMGMLQPEKAVYRDDWGVTAQKHFDDGILAALTALNGGKRG